MLVVQSVATGDMDLMPVLVLCFLATYKEDRRALPVERVQHAVWLPMNLDTKLAHVGVSRAAHA